MTDDSTHSFHNTNTVKNILTLSSVKTPSDPLGQEAAGTAGRERRSRPLSKSSSMPCFSTILIFCSVGKKQSAGTTLYHLRVEDEEPSPPLLPYAEIRSPPAPVHPLLPPSPSPASTGLPQPHAVLGCAWPLLFGDKTTEVGTARGSNMSQCFSESGERRIWLLRRIKTIFSERRETGYRSQRKIIQTA